MTNSRPHDTVGNLIPNFVPLTPQHKVAGAPADGWGISIASDSESLPHKVVVEPLSTFLPQVEVLTPRLRESPHRESLDIPPLAYAHASNIRYQTPLLVSQDSRGICWAFAGAAALEAAYARTGVIEPLSPHYVAHIARAYGNHTGPPNTSLTRAQGSADIVHHLKYWSVPTLVNVPFIDQTTLQNLANSIPRTNGALTSNGGGTREDADWFEYDLRNIPLMGRWFAQYRVKDYGMKGPYTNDDIKAAIRDGYDVVVDVYDKVNVGGHVLLIYGYNDLTGNFEVKNSQRLPGFQTIKYSGDPQFDILYTSTMFYITAVEPVSTQWAAMWIGRWETDHDGWRGRLIVRRFAEIRSDVLLPGPDNRISLGTWYGDDGQVLDVQGYFVDEGRGLFCNIGDQPFEIYLHRSDPYRAAGRCFWNGRDFGVVLSRGTALGAGGDFDRTKGIGFWDTAHDGQRGQLRIGADPFYVQSAIAAVRRTWIDPGDPATANRIDTHIDFGAGNPDQYFELLVNTREGGLLGGVTPYGGTDWPVEGRMSQNLYAIFPDGALRWHRHAGRSRLTADWDPFRFVGTGWSDFELVFGGGDGVIYARRSNGDLLWSFHDGRNQGTSQWQGPVRVGAGWGYYTRLFGGDGGLIYGIKGDGVLDWYRHLGRRDGSYRWDGPFAVGKGWDAFRYVFAGPDGCLYAVQLDGSLLWYRHYGHDFGYPIWWGPLVVGHDWNFTGMWAVGNGYIYALDDTGNLFLWRHHGFLTGESSWSTPVRVANDWTGVRVFAT